MGLDTDITKRTALDTISNKLSDICRKLDENEKQHAKLFDEITSLKISAQSDHPNCKTGIINQTKLQGLAERISSREKWGIAISVVLLGGVITALVSKL